MIEKSWNDCVGRSRSLAASLKYIRPGVWILLFVTLLTTVRGLRGFVYRHSGHRDEIANTIGSTAFVYANSPQADHSDSRIIYVKTSKDGIGVFSRDISDGKDRLLHEESRMFYGLMDRFHNHFSPFSPDDSLFAYTFRHTRGQHFYGQDENVYGLVVICRADSSEEVAQTETLDWDGIDMTWLTPDSLAWMGFAHENLTQARLGTHIHVFEKQANGEWNDRTLNLELTRPSCFTALSSDKLAWLDALGIRAIDIKSGGVAVLFQSQESQISYFNYCRQSSEFLVTYRDVDRTEGRPRAEYSLWRLKLGADGSNSFTRLTRDTDIQNAQWVNGGQGYAYLRQGSPMVRANSGAELVRLGQIDAYVFQASPDGRLLSFVGTTRDNPWGAIELSCYDIAAQALKGAPRASDSPGAPVSSAEPLHETVGMGSRILEYYLYRPSHFDRHKKYPLLMADTPFKPNVFPADFRGPAAALANCGAYTVVIDRPGWLNQIEDWEANVLAVRNLLVADPTIDASQIYLYATSAETAQLSAVVEKRPELWKGVIVVNPGRLPAFSQMNSSKVFPRILIGAGEDDRGLQRYRQYQKNACGRGILVEIQELPKTDHFITSTTAIREHTRSIVDFILNN